MVRRVSDCLLLLALTACTLPTQASEEADKSSPEPGAAAVASPGTEGAEEEHGELGVRMSRLQDLHADLWFAGSDGRRELADYFIHELEETFEALAEEHPTHNGVALEPLLEPVLGTTGAVHAVEQSLEEGDRTAFATAYDQLSARCSSCHRAAGHPYLEVHRPHAPRSVLLFPDRPVGADAGARAAHAASEG